MYCVYIIYSHSIQKFYVGQTNDIEDRINRHNSGYSLSTKHGKPWKLIYQHEFDKRSEAMLLETKIKKRGIRRYLEDIDFVFEV